MYVLRDRLRPAQVIAAAITVAPAKTPALPAPAATANDSPAPAADLDIRADGRAEWLDAFGDGLPVARTRPPLAPAPAPTLRVQSIVTGSYGRSCIINGRSALVGDVVEGARIVAIERTAVTIELDGREERLELLRSRGRSQIAHAKPAN